MFAVSDVVCDSLAKHVRNHCVSPRMSCILDLNVGPIETLTLPVSYFFFYLEKGFSVSAEPLALFPGAVQSFLETYAITVLPQSFSCASNHV